MTALKTGNVLLWPCAILIVAIGTVRAFQMRKYERRTAVLSFDQAKHSEPRYAVGAMVYAGVLGVWCFITIFGNDDAVAHMLCVAVTIGYTAGGAARNYGRPRISSIISCSPAGRCRWRWRCMADFYYIGLAVLLVLFFIGLKGINLSLHAIFVKALTSSFREAALAGQFDTALNNMPHGLCMFAADGRLAVMNHRFSEMMNLSDDLVQRGASAPDIIAACVSGGSISAASGKMILAEIENTQARDIITADPDIARSRSLSWTFQPMAGGGAVVLLEDITERRNAEARISHLARYDELTALPNRVNFRDEIGRLLASTARCRAVVGIAVHRSRPVQAGQRHPGSSVRRPAVVRGRRPAARHAAPGGFRGALRRRRIRGVPAEHQVERGSRRSGPADRRASERALQDRQPPGRDRRQRRHRDDSAAASAPIRF